MNEPDTALVRTIAIVLILLSLLAIGAAKVRARADTHLPSRLAPVSLGD